jgi:hypothetical protein
MVEVRYAGVVLGRSTQIRDWSAAGAFVGFAEPMPTGTPLVLKGEGIEQPARVVQVVESADLAVAGMRVEFGPATPPGPAAGESGAAPIATAPAAAETPPQPAMATSAAPVVEPAVAPAVTAGEASDGAMVDSVHGEAGSSAGAGKRRRRRR